MDWGKGAAFLPPLIAVGAFWLGRWMGYRRGYKDGEQAEYIRWRLQADEQHAINARRKVRISATWNGETHPLFEGPLAQWRQN